MNARHDEDIGAIVAETLAEQQRLQRDEIDALVLRAIVTILTSFGIEEEDRRTARRFSASETLAQERRTGAELYLQSGYHRASYRICRRSLAGHQGHAGEMIDVERMPP